MKRFRWLVVLLCCCVFPFAARADGIDVPLTITFGVGVFLPLLLFNATVETPIMGRFLGIKFSKLWFPWLKANVLSLLAGIPALVLNQALISWFLPRELGRRYQVYPFFLVLFILNFFAATSLVEMFYGRRIARKAGVQIGWASTVKGVILANLASYAVLGPIYFLVGYPKTDFHHFNPGNPWAKESSRILVAISPRGQLEAAAPDGRNHRVVVPAEVRDYVLSADAAHVLYRGKGDRFYLYNGGTNQLVPELGFWCEASEMDFSPAGKYAAFHDKNTHQICLFESSTGKVTKMTKFEEGQRCRLAWSFKENTFYLKSDSVYSEITLTPALACRVLTNPPSDLATHYYQVGSAWTGLGGYYPNHEQGDLGLIVERGWGGGLMVSDYSKTNAIRFKDPVGLFNVKEALFLEGSGEVLVEIGGFAYILDVLSKQMGQGLEGHNFIAIAEPFSKQADF